MLKLQIICMMVLTGLNNDKYFIGNEIGKGGEGQVFELSNHPQLVYKQYFDTPLPEKEQKLRQMIAMFCPEIGNFAAWPQDLLRDDTGVVCGFVMKKLYGFVPLHKLFSPMDRKQLFPEKGYNFLVHVARNVATAFHNLHQHGLVAGDVNEGNILVNAAGFVCFIDCDSFQVKKENEHYFCEVGVPRYTPPELLKKGTFHHILRTVNTDSFSLAILIFQLLFLGRHPFAGKNNTASDLDEETAIKTKEFAYSLEKKKKKLSPPVDSFAINNLPESIVALFHQAFEQQLRPEPAQWIQALEELLNNMSICGLTKLHVYPSKLSECPWCAFKNSRGIMYFLDDSYLYATSALSDIDNFINGFKAEQLQLKKWAGNTIQTPLLPNPIDKRFYRYKKSINLTIICILAATAPIAIINVYSILVTLAASFFVYKYSLWNKKLFDELERRTSEYQKLNEEYEKHVILYNNNPEIEKYNKNAFELGGKINDFKNLPQELETRKRILEQRIYNEQLNYYLKCFKIENNAIPGLGAAKRNSLLSGGIINAYDINLLQTKKVQGIGPKNQQILLSWQRQLASGFVYIPEPAKIEDGMKTVNHEIETLKIKLENSIKNDFQKLTYKKQQILNNLNFLEQVLNDLNVKTRQAELDYIAFQKIVKW